MKEYFKYIVEAVFAARLPDPTRTEIKEILSTYGMSEYDDFCIIKKKWCKREMKVSNMFSEMVALGIYIHF